MTNRTGVRPLALVILAVTAAILILAPLPGYFEDEDAQAQAPDISEHPDPLDPRMLELDRSALDDAYHDTMMHLFSVWTRDQTGQPKRAITGANQARRAYIEVSRELEIRRAKQMGK